MDINTLLLFCRHSYKPKDSSQPNHWRWNIKDGVEKSILMRLIRRLVLLRIVTVGCRGFLNNRIACWNNWITMLKYSNLCLLIQSGLLSYWILSLCCKQASITFEFCKCFIRLHPLYCRGKSQFLFEIIPGCQLLLEFTHGKILKLLNCLHLCFFFFCNF